VLAGLGGADDVFRVHAVGQHDVDDVDLVVVLDLVERVVVVDVLFVDAELLAVDFALSGCPLTSAVSFASLACLKAGMICPRPSCPRPITAKPIFLPPLAAACWAASS
jgi:hypothetical protein